MIICLDLKDFWASLTVRVMKISAAPLGMPRARASTLRSWMSDCSSRYSIMN